MTERPNVLVTSASRKVWLVDAFRRALAAEGGGTVVAVDADRYAPALYAADIGRVVPALDEPGFEDALSSLCEEHRVGLVVPSRDGELEWFARRVEAFGERGARVACSRPEAVATCLDKLKFDRWCRARGLPVPRRFDRRDVDEFPVVVKPRAGSGSSDVRIARDRAELADAFALVADPIVQELVDGVEHTIDVASDLDGRVLGTVVRRRDRVEHGESVVGVTVCSPELEELARNAAALLGLRGPSTVQAFVRSDGTPCLVELNPRFGGGAALGFAAGLDTPRLLVRAARGEPNGSVGAVRAGLAMLRHRTDLFVDEVSLCAG
jgi:carbamoyl-phosphate synthase large subunit